VPELDDDGPVSGFNPIWNSNFGQIGTLVECSTSGDVSKIFKWTPDSADVSFLTDGGGTALWHANSGGGNQPFDATYWALAPSVLFVYWPAQAFWLIFNLSSAALNFQANPSPSTASTAVRSTYALFLSYDFDTTTAEEYS